MDHLFGYYSFLIIQMSFIWSKGFAGGGDTEEPDENTIKVYLNLDFQNDWYKINSPHSNKLGLWRADVNIFVAETKNKNKTHYEEAYGYCSVFLEFLDILTNLSSTDQREQCTSVTFSIPDCYSSVLYTDWRCKLIPYVERENTGHA